MYRHEFHRPHLISVATLPCEIRNTDNVKLQQDITKENGIKSNLSSIHLNVMCFIFVYFTINLMLLKYQ